MKTFKLTTKDGDSYYELKNPALIIDNNRQALLGVIEKSDPEEHFKIIKDIYREENKEQHLELIILPLDQTIINKAYQDVKYALTLKEKQTPPSNIVSYLEELLYENDIKLSNAITTDEQIEISLITKALTITINTITSKIA